MVQSVLTIGAVLAVALIVLGLILTRSSKATYLPYYAPAVLFVSGILLAILPTMIGKVEIMGAGLGGWGIALLFASGVGFIVTSVNDVYVRH